MVLLCFRQLTQLNHLTVRLVMVFVYPRKVCLFVYFCTLGLGDIKNDFLIPAGKTAVNIEGKTSQYATKIGFKEGESISYTYIKSGTTGKLKLYTF